jgi:hypothetical protein
MSGFAGLSRSRNRKPEGSTSSGYAQNLRKECVGLVAGQAVLTAKVKDGEIRMLLFPRPTVRFADYTDKWTERLGLPTSIHMSRNNFRLARHVPTVWRAGGRRVVIVPENANPSESDQIADRQRDTTSIPHGLRKQPEAI